MVNSPLRVALGLALGFVSGTSFGYDHRNQHTVDSLLVSCAIYIINRSAPRGWISGEFYGQFISNTESTVLLTLYRTLVVL